MPVEWLNGSWISPGAKIGKLALIGAFTVNASRDVPEGSTWFGSPAIGAPPAPPIPNPHTHIFGRTFRPSLINFIQKSSEVDQAQDSATFTEPSIS